MANRFFRNAGTAWNDNANWDAVSSGGLGPASFPTILDDAIFDAGSGSCTLTASAAALSITLANYTSTLSTGSFSLDTGIGALDGTNAGGATLDLTGTGTHTWGGDVLFEFLGTFTRGGSVVVLTGLSNTLEWTNATHLFETLTIAAGAHYTVTGSFFPRLKVVSALTLGGKLTLSSTSGYTPASGNARLIINSAGELAGSGAFISFDAGQTVDVQAGGQFNATGNHDASNGLEFISAATYKGNWLLRYPGAGTANYRFSPGGSVFEGSLEFRKQTTAGDLVIDFAANDGTLECQGDLTVTEEAVGVSVTTGASGALTMGGSNNQTITTPASWPAELGTGTAGTTVDKTAGKLTLLSDLHVAKWTMLDGNVDLNTFTLTSAGDVSCDKGLIGAPQFSDGTTDDMSNGAIAIESGTLLLNGASGGDLLGINNLDFDISAGVLFDVTWCDVTNSQAIGAGAPIDATDGTSVDTASPPTTGWDFGGGPDLFTATAATAQEVQALAATATFQSVFTSTAATTQEVQALAATATFQAAAGVFTATAAMAALSQSITASATFLPNADIDAAAATAALSQVITAAATFVGLTPPTVIDTEDTVEVNRVLHSTVEIQVEGCTLATEIVHVGDIGSKMKKSMVQQGVPVSFSNIDEVWIKVYSPGGISSQVIPTVEGDPADGDLLGLSDIATWTVPGRHKEQVQWTTTDGQGWSGMIELRDVEEKLP